MTLVKNFGPWKIQKTGRCMRFCFYYIFIEHSLFLWIWKYWLEPHLGNRRSWVSFRAVQIQFCLTELQGGSLLRFYSTKHYFTSHLINVWLQMSYAIGPTSQRIITASALRANLLFFFRHSLQKIVLQTYWSWTSLSIFAAWSPTLLLDDVTYKGEQKKIDVSLSPQFDEPWYHRSALFSWKYHWPFVTHLLGALPITLFYQWNDDFPTAYW